MLTLVVLEVGDDIMRGESPRPGEFAVPFAAYLMLALVAELGEGPAKTAAAMGWLVVVVSALNRVRNNPTDNLFTNLVKFAGRGPQTPVGSKQTQPVGGGPAAGTMSGNIDTYV